MRQRRAIRLAEQVLAQAKVTAPPVDVLRIAHDRGIRVRFGALPNDLSGFLVHEKDKALIGVNSLHPKARQRFTLAHELGHYLLHPTDNFVDRKFILFRDTRSSQAIDRREMEANEFAAELLMPELFLQKLLKGETVDLEDEDRVAQLARRFGVSNQALVFRLINLGLGRRSVSR
jgi:Zn-dependent peptidase ImmA (M78 family)